MYYATTFNQGRQEGQTSNSTYPKGGVLCSKDSFVVNGSFAFQNKFCGKSPALRVAANRQPRKSLSQDCCQSANPSQF